MTAWLASAILSLVVVHVTPSGAAIYAPHVRGHRLGAEAYAHELADAFVAAGGAHDVDPLLLAALAHFESAFRDGAVADDRVGSWGVLQLNPRGASYAFARRSCRRFPGVCVLAQVDAGALEMRRAIDACDGSIDLGLGYYRSGACAPHKGTARVLGLRDTLRAQYAQHQIDEHPSTLTRDVSTGVVHVDAREAPDALGAPRAGVIPDSRPRVLFHPGTALVLLLWVGLLIRTVRDASRPRGRRS